MKKVLFVLAFVAVYGVSMAMTSSSTVTIVDDAQVTFVADLDDDTVVTLEEGNKDKDKEKKKAKSKSKSGKKAKGCDDSKTKSSGCDGKAKSDCGSACGGEKK